LQGRIHEDDIPKMVSLLRDFHWVHYISRAVAIWTEADGYFEQFKEAAATYHAYVMHPPADKERVVAVLSTIRRLNEDLTGVEEEFSAVLSDGSRWLERVVITLLFLAVLAVESFGLTVTFLTARGLSRGLSDLNEAAHRIGQGDFKSQVDVESRDEIGLLGESINNMGEMLDRSYGDLERRVAERTHELSTMASENAKLYIEAQNAVKMRDEFFSIASHELKTPLTALNLQIHLLTRAAEALPKNEETAKLLNLVKATGRQSARLATLSHELMDLTRLRLGKLELHCERDDLVRVVQDVVSQLGFDASQAGSAITVHAAHPVRGDFDPARMTQVATNLISNAIKYGEGKPIDVFVSSADGKMLFEVKDQGMGIPSDLQDRIFERFERAVPDAKIMGLGLGLYIARQLVLAHNGEISVESRKGEGSTFRVRLPLLCG
jgi:signal transduction histidine kinase